MLGIVGRELVSAAAKNAEPTFSLEVYLTVRVNDGLTTTFEGLVLERHQLFEILKGGVQYTRR